MLGLCKYSAVLWQRLELLWILGPGSNPPQKLRDSGCVPIGSVQGHAACSLVGESLPIAQATCSSTRTPSAITCPSSALSSLPCPLTFPQPQTWGWNEEPVGLHVDDFHASWESSKQWTSDRTKPAGCCSFVLACWSLWEMNFIVKCQEESFSPGVGSQGEWEKQLKC